MSKLLSEEILEKKWQEATIKRDIIFTKVFGENKKLTLELLQIILPKLKIEEIIDIIPEDREKENIVYRGVRFDVYVKDENGRMYDIEMQVVNHHDLGKRIAYYQNKLSSKALKPSQKFFEKNDTFVIFVCDFDYFQLGLPVYHTTMRLKEDLNKIVDTGEHNVILNSRAKDFSSVSPEVKAFLEYVRENKVSNEFTKDLDREVKKIKSSTEVRDSFMTWEEKLAEERYYAGKEAEEKGMEKGIEKGKREMVVNAIKNQKKLGNSRQDIINSVADFLSIDKEEVAKYYDEEMLVK
ncbi:MAG TPA: Rpn family recombination-promoting nuclease/putative transposase [Ligilactobacillus salivarius]|uniref:Rpn family recombination-promoting nuclease/putative transposase n=1 Tax=Ligilactobacillus salivarius TaxID=1624 RepID=A0A921LJK5_9LACO|nr:Rpn family recombination-promoting nuclease/putative transposase [Ligilactobacillus salivarius]